MLPITNYQTFVTLMTMKDMRNAIHSLPFVQENSDNIKLQKNINAMNSIFDEIDQTILEMTDLNTKLLDIIKTKSFKKGNFTLASGKATDYFFDLKLTMLDPEGGFLIANLIIEKILQIDPTYTNVCGTAMGAIPLVSMVASLSYFVQNPLNAMFVRKDSKDHVLKKIIEGNKPPVGTKIVCLEDVTTTGGSVMISVNALRNEGYIVEDVITIVDRMEGAEDSLSDEGISLFSIFDIRHFQ